MFGWFLRKKEVERLKEEIKKSFEDVKKDVNSVGSWIKHLDSEKDYQKNEILEIKDVLSSVQEELEGLKNVVSIMNEVHPRGKSGQVFKQQTGVQTAFSAVQTGVQTPNLDQFSLTERAIIWILLNTDMKLSYDDLASILGKERSTVRGQINAIRQKSGVIEEVIEKKGKKRVFIPEEIKEKMLKRSKVRVDKGKKAKKAVKKAA